MVSVRSVFTLTSHGDGSLHPCTANVYRTHRNMGVTKGTHLPRVRTTLSFDCLNSTLLVSHGFSGKAGTPVPRLNGGFSMRTSRMMCTKNDVAGDVTVTHLRRGVTHLSLSTKHSGMHFLLVNCCLSLFGRRGVLRMCRGGVRRAGRIVRRLHTGRYRKVILGGSVAHCRLLLTGLRLAHARVRGAVSVLGNGLAAALNLPRSTEVRPSAAVLSGTLPVRGGRG